MKFVARQINADDTLLTILLRQLHRIDVLLWCNRPIAAEDQATANAEIALTASQSFERGGYRVFHGEFPVARQRGSKPRLEVDHVVPRTIFAQLVGDAFLRNGVGQYRVEDLKALEEISQAAAIAVHLHKLRQFQRIVRWQLDPQLIPQLRNRHHPDRPVEMQMKINLGELLEVH